MNGAYRNAIGFWSPVGHNYVARGYAHAVPHKKQKKQASLKLQSFKPQNPKVYRKKESVNRLFGEDAHSQAVFQKKQVENCVFPSGAKTDEKSTSLSSGLNSSTEEPTVHRAFFSKARACIAPTAQALPVFHF